MARLSSRREPSGSAPSSTSRALPTRQPHPQAPSTSPPAPAVPQQPELKFVAFTPTATADRAAASAAKRSIRSHVARTAHAKARQDRVVQYQEAERRRKRSLAAAEKGDEVVVTGGAKTWGAPPRLESAVDAAESSPSSYDDAATASAGPRGAMPSHVVDTFLSDASPFLPLFCPLRVAASRAIACSPPPPNRTAAISTHHPPQQHRHIPIPSPSPLTSLPFSGSRIAAFAAFGGAAVYVSPFESYLVDHYVSRVLSSLPHCSAHQHADGVPGGDMHERLMLARWVPLALSDEGMLAGLCLASCRSLAYEFAVGRTRRRHAEDTRGRPSDSGAEVEEIQEEVQDRGGTSTSTSSPATSSSSADAGAGSTDEHWCNTVTTTTLTKPGMDVGHKVGGLGGSDARIMAAAAAGRWVGAASDVDFAGSSWQNDGTSRWTRAVEKDSPASVPAMEPQLRLYLNRALAFKADCIGSVNRAISESGAWGGVGDATIAKVLMLASDEFMIGNIATSRVHVRAVKRMVDMKGGPEALGLNGFLGQLVDFFVNDPNLRAMEDVVPGPQARMGCEAYVANAPVVAH